MQRGIGGTHAITAMVNHVLDDYEIRGKGDLASELVEMIRKMTEVADERGHRAGWDAGYEAGYDAAMTAYNM